MERRLEVGMLPSPLRVPHHLPSSSQPVVGRAPRLHALKVRVLPAGRIEARLA